MIFVIDSVGLDNDPTGPKNGENEWIELVYTWEEDASLDGWTISNAADEVLMTLEDVVVQSPNLTNGHTYIVLVLGEKLLLSSPDLAVYNISTYPKTKVTYCITLKELLSYETPAA